MKFTASARIVGMHMLARTLWHTLVIAKIKKPVDLSAITRTTFRVWPTDIDVLLHMNNGKYLSVLDVARFEYTVRSGLWQKLQEHGWYTVVGAQTITYRKSLNPFNKFSVETRFIAMDERAVYIEQRFVRHGEIYARAYIQGRFLKKSGGTVSSHELAAALNINPQDYPLAPELKAWIDTVRLPSTKKPAKSVWN